MNFLNNVFLFIIKLIQILGVCVLAMFILFVLVSLIIAIYKQIKKELKK